MKKQLTLDEHRALGTALSKIRHELGGADRLNSFKLNSWTQRLLKRAARRIDRLRSKLDGLLFKQNPTCASPSIYYGHQEVSEELSIEALRVCLDYAVGEIINGKVPAPVLDLYLRCERTLFVMKLSIIDHPEDARGRS